MKITLPGGCGRETLGRLKQSQTSKETSETIRNDKGHKCECSRQDVDRINYVDLFTSNVFHSLFFNMPASWARKYSTQSVCIVSLITVYQPTACRTGISVLAFRYLDRGVESHT
jgi:hypothetical protein